MRKTLSYILVIGFFWILVARFAEVERLATVLVSGKWEWILVAFLLQVLYHAVYAGLYQAAFHTVGVHSRFRDLWPVVFASLFVNVVAPAGGASGAALFVDDAARRGESPAKATAGTLLVTIAELGSFVAILVPAMYYLFTRHSLKTFELAGAGIFITVILGLTLVLLIGLWMPSWINRLLGLAHSLANRVWTVIGKRDLLSDTWAGKIVTEFSEAADAVRQHPGRLGRTLAIAAFAHMIDLACLYSLFLAFDQPVGFGTLVAGYSMAILFWVVSPTPQGMGVVEAVVALVYASLGVPGNKAIVISLAFRGLAFWIPLLAGVLVIRKLRSFASEERAQTKVFEVHVAAVAVTIVGCVDILSAITPSLTERIRILQPFLSDATRHGFRLAAVLAGFGLLMISRSLWRRKRAAWTITLVLLITSFVSHLIKGLDFEEASIVAAMIFWLWRVRRHYQVPSDSLSLMHGVRVLVLSIFMTTVYGTLGLYLLDRHFAVHYGFYEALLQTLTMFFEFYNPGLEPITGFGRYFATSIYVVGLVSLTSSLVLMLRSVFIRQPATRAERERATGIVQSYGMSSLASITLLPDKSYYFTSGGSAVAFVTNSGIGLALGDPIGPALDAASAIEEFRSYCIAHDWRPAFYQTLPDHLEIYRANDFDTLCIGQEAVVDVRSFSIEGGAMKSVRTSVNRLSRLGFTADVLEPPLSQKRLEELRLISDEWLAEMHGSEKRFSLGWFDENYIRSCPIMAVRSESGTIVAFANIISEYQRNEATIDLMRRRSDAPNGTMDFLFVKLFEWAAEMGRDTFNLGLSPLAGVGENPDDPIVEKTLGFVYEHLNQFYSFKGLHSFKEKFRPQWSPRYLVYDGLATLLTTSYAIVRADSGSRLVASMLGKRLKSPGDVGERDAESAAP